MITMRRARIALIIVFGVLASPTVVRSQDVITVGAQTGQQIFFNNTLTRSYNFGITTTGAGLTFNSIDVNVKGGNTAANQNPVILSVYGGLGGTGSVLATGTIPASQMTNQFDFRTVPLNTTLQLGAGGYSVKLETANTVNYYIKDGNLTLTSTSGAVLNNLLWVEDTNTDGTAGTSLVASGTVLASWATGTNAAAFGNYRVTSGSALSASISLTNNSLATSNNKTQALAATGTTTPNVTLSSLPSPYLSVGQSQNFTAALGTGITGPNSGTATLAFSSVSGTSATTGTTPLGNGTIALSGTGYDWANATYSGTAFAFGYIHRGGAAASGTVAIGNQTVTNASYQDRLDVSASTGNPLVAATGFSGLAASAGGANRSNVIVAIGTGTAGSLNSTLALSLVSNANGVAGLSNGTATVVGSPAAITTTGTVFTGQSTWNTNGGGEWGTLASNFGTNWTWSAFDGSPGVDAGFTNTDTATFGSALTSGTATVTVTAATPSVKSITFNNGAAAYAVTGVSGGSLALLNAGTAAAAVTVAAGSHALSLPVALGSDASLDIAAESLLTMAGVVSGAKGIAKNGAGTTILSGNNTYGGVTTVAAGRLLIHGDQTAATGAITVESGATLGGRGAAGGAVTVLSGGTLSPGASVESLAVGTTTLSGTSTFLYELDSSALLSVGADLLVASGNLTIESGSILELTDLASSPTAFTAGTKFSLISYGTSSWNNGLFTFGGDILANGDRFTAGLNEWEIRYDDPTGGSNFTVDQLAGSSVTITAVPEPGAFALLAVGVLAGVAVKRRRPTVG